MKTPCSLSFLAALLCPLAFAADAAPRLELSSHYQAPDRSKLVEKNAASDYGLKSDSSLDQSATLQAAIDSLAKQGGGILFIPKGTYRFGSVSMRSNIHMEVEAGTVLRPVLNKKKKVNMLLFGAGDKNSSEFIENCSISGRGGRYIVDYSDTDPAERLGVRFAALSLVRNFSIADADIRDAYTVYCGFVMSPSRAKDTTGWAITRPTQGELRDCTITHANAGYGLVQFHGAQDVYLENIEATGGVTLRLESGASNANLGVFDICAKNVRSLDGRCAVLLSPHVSQNGRVLVDGVWSKGSAVAILASAGFVDKNRNRPEGTVAGRFSNDTIIANIHAIAGSKAQIDNKFVYTYEPEQEIYKQLRIINYGHDKFLNGPSICPVFDATLGSYTVRFENITSEGFSHHQNSVMKAEEVAEREAKKWAIARDLPCNQDAAKSKKD